MKLGLQPNQFNSRTNILNHGIPRPNWELQYLASWVLGKVLLGAHSGSFSLSTSLYSNKNFNITWEHTDWITTHDPKVAGACWRWETHLCQLNREKMEDVSVYFDKCKWILLFVKMLSGPQWNELWVFFPLSGWRERSRREMNAQDRLLWFEMKTNNFREKKKRLSLHWRPWHSCRYVHELIIKILKCGINHVVFKARPR